METFLQGKRKRESRTLKASAAGFVAGVLVVGGGAIGIDIPEEFATQIAGVIISGLSLGFGMLRMKTKLPIIK